MTDNQGVMALDCWVPWMLYHNTKTYEKIGQPTYPNELDYCNVQGNDLKYSPEAWSATKGLLLTKSTHYAQMVATISSVMHQYFNLDAYPTRDRGTFGPLTRFADMHERFQLRVITAKQHIKDALDIAVNIVPRDMDQMMNTCQLFAELSIWTNAQGERRSENATPPLQRRLQDTT